MFPHVPGSFIHVLTSEHLWVFHLPGVLLSWEVSRCEVFSTPLLTIMSPSGPGPSAKRLQHNY